jgi:hypothetical protein
MVSEFKTTRMFVMMSAFGESSMSAPLPGPPTVAITLDDPTPARNMVKNAAVPVPVAWVKVSGTGPETLPPLAAPQLPNWLPVNAEDPASKNWCPVFGLDNNVTMASSAAFRAATLRVAIMGDSALES